MPYISARPTLEILEKDFCMKKESITNYFKKNVEDITQEMPICKIKFYKAYIKLLEHETCKNENT